MKITHRHNNSRGRRVNGPSILACLSLFVIALAIWGCESVDSSRVEVGAKPSRQIQGMAYFLPYGKVHIVAIRNDFLVTNTGLAVWEDTNGNHVTNMVSVTRVTTNVFTEYTSSLTNFATNAVPETLTYSSNFTLSATNYLVSNTPPTLPGGSNRDSTAPAPAPKPGETNKSGKAQGESSAGSNPTNKPTLISYTNQTTTLSYATNQTKMIYPTNYKNTLTTIVTVTNEQPFAATNYIYNITVSTEYTADRTNLYVLNPALDCWHDDSISFAVDSNMLLMTINTTNTGQAGNVMVEAAQAAIQSFQLAAGGFGVPSGNIPSPNLPSENPATMTDEFGAKGKALKPADFSADDVNASQSDLLEAAKNHPSLLTLPAGAEKTLKDDLDLMTSLRTARISGQISKQISDLEQQIETLKANEASHNKLLPEHVHAVDQASQSIQALSDTLKNFQSDIFKKHLADVLNGVIGKVSGGDMKPDTADWEREGFHFRPETKLVEQLIGKGLGSANLKKYLLTMILRDTLPNTFVHSSVQPNRLPPKSIDVTFDPFKAEEVEIATNILNVANIYLDLRDFAAHAADYAGSRALAGNTNAGGVFYRPPIPYQMRVSDRDTNTVWTTVLLPNKAPVLHLDLSKEIFVQRIAQVTMTNGYVTSYGMSKPSSMLAIATIPVTILSDVTSGLTNLIQLKLNLASGQNTLQNATLAQQTNQNMMISNQVTALSNMMALINAQQAYIQAKAAAQSNAPVAPAPH